MKDFATLKYFPEPDQSEESFVNGFIKKVEAFIKAHSEKRFEEATEVLGKKDAGYVARLIAFARLLAYGYSQETINHSPSWTVSEFKKNPTADMQYVKDPTLKLYLPSEIYRAEKERRRSTEIVDKQIDVNATERQKALAKHKLIISQASSEVRRKAESMFPPSPNEGELMARYRVRQIEQTILELMGSEKAG